MKRKLRILAVILISVIVIFPSGNFYAQTQRNPVLEECTGTWCQWCPCGHTIMAQIKAAMPNAILIGYHGPANGTDPFSYFSGNSILSSLGFSAYPTGIVDRVSGIQNRGAWQGWMNNRYSVPATVSIEVDRDFNPLTRQFTAAIDFTALTNLNGQYKFNVILLEDSIIWSQTGNGSCPGNPNYVHNHVVRDMMNGALGEEIINGAWNSGTVITKNINRTIPLPGGVGPDMVWDKCRIVVMVYKAGSPVSSNAEIQQAVEMPLISPDYVATISSTSPDLIISSNTNAGFTAVLYNKGLLDDTYYLTASHDGPAGWMGEFTTIHGSFPFGQTDSVDVLSGDSTAIDITVALGGVSGSAIITLNYQSKNSPGVSGSLKLRVVTTTGVDVLIVDGTEDGYGELVLNSVENVYSGTAGVVLRNALNPSLDLDNFQLITWSSGKVIPVFHPEEVDLLQDYLDGDGKLFINGQDIGNDIFDAGGQSQFAQGFYNNYLHASFLGNGSSFLINGIAGDPITDGVQFVLNSVYTRTPDNILPYDSYGSSIFKYFNGPNIAGIKAAANNHKVVYFGFSFEQITENNIRDTLISRIIRYSGISPLQLPFAPVLISPANLAVIDSASVLFVWQQSQPQVTKYWFELDTTDQFSNPFVNSDVTDTTYLYSGLLPGKNYWWRVKALNPAGWGDFSEVRTFSTLATGIGDDESSIPDVFSLGQNYPNPFNPTTTITYSLAKESQVSIKIYDVMGREVVQLISDRQPAGNYNIEFNASALASGTYFYKLMAGDFMSVKKMILIK